MPKRQTVTDFGAREGELKQGVLKVAVIAGGAAGNHTVTGIRVGDELVSVIHVAGAGTDVTDIANLTSEFSVSADDTINNTGGTSSAGGKLLIHYIDRT